MTLGRSDKDEKDIDDGFQALKKRIKRSDAGADVIEAPEVLPDTADTAIVDATPHEGNLLKINKPRFISVVGLPANQRGFRVVRDDQDQGGQKVKTNHPVVRRTRRASDTSPVLQLTFPEGSDETLVATALKEYGLDGYKVQQRDGRYVAIRGDLKTITKDGTVDIALTEDGLVATVARADKVQEAKGNLTISSIEFDRTKFTLEEVQRWVVDKCVDGVVQEPQNPDECYVVRRSDVPDNEETRRMVLEDGVQAVVMRSDVMSIPDGYIAVVNETAYGNWGWGQLDFAAAMGDKVFSEAMREALYTLDDVLRNVVIWSPLPLDTRKELANRALAQFGDYISTVMDSLPRQLMVSVVRSANPENPPKEKTMSQDPKTQPAQPLQQQPTHNPPEERRPGDLQPTHKPTEKHPDATPPAQSPEAPATDPKETSVSRADVQKMIEDAMTKALSAARGEQPQETKVEAKPDTVTREDLTQAITAVVAPMTEAIKALQGTTVMRSASEPTPTKEEQKKKDVFRGAPAFAGLRVRPTQQ